MFNRGISKEGDLVDLGVTKELVRKSGAFYSFGDTRLGQGREAAKEFLLQNPEIAVEIESQIRESISQAIPVAAASVVDNSDSSLTSSS